MYNCPQCQKPFELGTKFCESCGYNLEAGFLIDPVCPQCQKEFPSGTKFCSEDGSTLTTKDKLIPKCVICRTEYPESTKFCPKDGGEVIAEAYRKITQPQQTSPSQVSPTVQPNIHTNNKSEFQKSLETKFTWLAWLFGIGIVTLMLIIGIFPLMAAIVLGLIIQYQAWNSVQTEQSRITPGQAVGFQLIPIFNFYWFFVAYPKLVTAIEDFAKSNNQNIPNISKKLALSIPILNALSIPFQIIMESIRAFIINSGADDTSIIFFAVGAMLYLSYILSIAVGIFIIIFLKQVIDALIFLDKAGVIR